MAECFFAAGAAVIVHELGHLIALKIMGKRIQGIHIQPGGMLINYGGAYSAWEDLAAALAGPLAGIIYCMAVRFLGDAAELDWLTFSGELSLAYSLFNLLPVFPMDGGMVFTVFCQRLAGEETSSIVCACIDRAFAIVLTGCGLYMLLSFHGTALFAAGIWLLYFQSEDKRCCKNRGNNIK